MSNEKLKKTLEESAPATIVGRDDLPANASAEISEADLDAVSGGLIDDTICKGMTCQVY